MKLSLVTLFCFLLTASTAQKTGQELVDSLVLTIPSIRNDSMLLKVYNDIGREYLSFNPRLGISYAKQGMAVAKKMNFKRGVARELNLLGLLVGDTGNSTQARAYFDMSSAIQREIHNSWGLISSLNNTGRIFERESNYREAIDYYYKALTIAEEIKSDTQISLVSGNLSSIYILQGNLEKGLDFARKTLHHAEAAPSPYNIGKGFELIAYISSLKKDTPTARVYYKKALDTYEAMGDSSLISQALVTIGPLEYPDYLKAIHTMLNAQRILDTISPYSYYSTGNLNNLANAYMILAKQGSSSLRNAYIEKAESCLQRAIVICRQIKNKNSLALVYGSYSELEELKGHGSAALNYLREKNVITDSIFSQEKKNDLAEIESKHNLDLKNKEIAINKLELDNQRKTKVVLLIGISLLTIMGSLLWWQNRLRKKTNTTLMVLNNQLDDANKIKARFFGILSHDLRSPISNMAHFLTLMKNDPLLFSASDHAKYQQQFTQKTENLLQTMETMLIWSKDQMGNFKPSITAVNVNELFAYLKTFFSQDTPFELIFENPWNLSVTTDENYIKVIMQNLTANAIKSLQNKPGAQIVWKAHTKKNKTILSVSDNGPGMKSEQMKVIYQDDMAVNTKSGFGFHLIRDLAKAIQCTISIDSVAGTGTTVYLYA